MQYRVNYLLNGIHKRATLQVRNKEKAIQMIALLLTINGHSNFVIGDVHEE
jgi:hypothetical protein